jgi:hypothetical protein
MGPIVVHSIPQGALDALQLTRIARLIEEMEHKGRFICYIDDQYAVNYTFEIQSQRAPFLNELFLLTLVFEQGVALNVENAITGEFQAFAEKLRTERNLYYALYLDDLDDLSMQQQKNAVALNERIGAWASDLYDLLVQKFFPEIHHLNA